MDAYFGFLAEAEPGESHELALAVGEGVLGVDYWSHAGTSQLPCWEKGETASYLTGESLGCRDVNPWEWEKMLTKSRRCEVDVGVCVVAVF